MEILVCGTAAAEGWPALFCTCGPCGEARRLGGKNIRSRAAYMIGERVRVDFGPDSNLHMQKYDLAYERLEHLIVTHSHDDHWFPVDLKYRRAGFSDVGGSVLQVWGNEKVEQRFLETGGPGWEDCFIQFHRIAPVPFQFSSLNPEASTLDLGNGLTATPILAAHDPAEECVNYLLEQNGRHALLGHDTGWYAPSTWDSLAGRKLHLVLLDCTYGSMQHDCGHLGCEDVVRARDRMAKVGALAQDAVVIATHFSHNGGWLHEDLERFFTPHGIQVAYDGLMLTP